MISHKVDSVRDRYLQYFLNLEDKSEARWRLRLNQQTLPGLFSIREDGTDGADSGFCPFALA